MKLRSGKILKNDLPFQVNKKLNKALTDFKTFFVNNEDFAKELIQLIASANNLDTRVEMSRMIEEKFNEVRLSPQKETLLATSGLLLRLITGYDSVYENNHIQPNFHGIIQKKMLETFDMDISLTGIVDQNENIEI